VSEGGLTGNPNDRIDVKGKKECKEKKCAAKKIIAKGGNGT